MKKSISKTHNKENRLNIRASHYQKEIIAEAARIRKTTISNFVLGSAYQEAQEVLANETNFQLASPEWEAFCKILDRNPSDIESLKKLLTEPGIFDHD